MGESSFGTGLLGRHHFALALLLSLVLTFKINQESLT